VTTQTPVRPTPDERPAARPWARVLRVVTGPVALRRWAVTALVVNVLIVVTGGLVRLTASGLGCPTWPRCSETSFVTHPELGVHGAIEFGNRLLTFVLVAVVALTWIAALRLRDASRTDVRGGRRRDLRWLAGGLLLGIPAQIVIGGISVLTHLNPWVVGLHLVVSMALVGIAVGLVRSSWGSPVVRVDRGPAVAFARVAFAGMVAAVWLGTVVTGSGPHAGDLTAVRNGLDGGLVAHVHAAAVWVTMAFTLAALLVCRSRAVVLLLAVEVLQAVLGLAQYQLGVPVPLVALHLLGASLSVAAATNVLLAVRPRRVPAAAGA
jgi:cytochrome c oxidase assembly protein subunit 15